MKMNRVFVEELGDGILLHDERRDEELVISDEDKEKIVKYFEEHYAQEEYGNIDLILDYPFKKINVTNNVHSYARTMSRAGYEGYIALDNIVGKTEYGELGYDYEVEKSPDFDMESIQIATIDQPDSGINAGRKTLAIYIPDPEKGEKGSYKAKYEKAITGEEDKLYFDNIVEREDRIIPIEELELVGRDVEKENKKKESEYYVSTKEMESLSKNASRQNVKSFLDEAAREINSQERE